jgi:hypothetical protein
MAQVAPKQVAANKIQRISLSNWLKALESTFDDDRKDQNGLKTVSNSVIEQNGTVRPRPSMVPCGTAFPGTVLGTVYSYVDSLTTGLPVNKMICVCLVAGVANAYTSADGGAWTKITGKNYSTTAKCYFEQIDNTVLVSNGTDNLSYFDILTNVIIPFTALTTPIAPTIAATGIGGTNYTYRYRVSAVSNGETAASIAGTIAVTKVRDQWAGGTTEYVTLTITRVTGATRYNIYVGDQAGFEYYLDTVPDPGSGTTFTYKDDSSLALNTNRLAPNGDSTAGPKVTRCTNVTGQIYMVGDSANLYRVWFGGTGDAALDFSAFDGGGWVEIDKGGRNLPVSIRGFRDGHGNPVASCFMKGTSGRGKLEHLTATSTTIGDTIITYMAITEANGQDGTDAPDGVIYARDSLWYPSRDGFKTTGTKAMLQNILSTDNFSDQIIPDVKSLNVKNMASCVGIEFEGRLYWSLPVSGSTTNNQMWVCDLNRNGIWTNPWYVNVDWLWLYDDSSGTTHMLALSGNAMYEFSYGQLTQDGSTAFSVDIASGLIKFSPDGMEWGSVIDVTFVLERPQGTIVMNVVGKTQDAPLTTVGTDSFTPTSSPVGWNEPAHYWNKYNFPYNAVVSTPTVFGSAREEVVIEIGEELKWLTWEVSSIVKGTDFQLADVIIRYVDVGVLDS